MLNPTELQSSTALKLLEHIDKRIEVLRSSLEAVGTSVEETEGLRRCLLEMRKFRKLLDPPEPPKMAQSDPYFRPDER